MSISAFLTLPGPKQRMREGPLGRYVDLYAGRLVQQGHSAEVCRSRTRVISDLSRWMEKKKLVASNINDRTLDQYCRYRRRFRSVRSQDRSALGRLQALLREIGVCRPRPSVVLDARERAVQEFKQYLSEKIGLKPLTIIRYVPIARQFLKERFPDTPLSWTELSSVDVISFVERHARDHSQYAAHRVCSPLRIFLRYLRHLGKIDRDLASAVPSIARWRLSALPGSFSPKEARAILDRCDRQSVDGKRDYAILLLLARLGLRANEIVTLILNDIDWHSGQLTLRRTKTEEVAHLPLPAEVGEALADYLKNGRPPSVSRRVFLRNPAPHIGFSDSTSIWSIVRKALTRAGVDATRRSPHVFRHFLATQLLREGASLSEIGQLLRHRDLNSTRIYAKVDLAALRTLALPWPGDVR